jgi:hypothetical protein
MSECYNCLCLDKSNRCYWNVDGICCYDEDEFKQEVIEDE